MKTYRLTTSKKPDLKERAEFMSFMRMAGYDRVVLTDKETGEETVLTLEVQDGEGRTLLHD